MEARTIRLATRGSPLARLQAERVGTLLTKLAPGTRFELVIVRTRGDIDSAAPLSSIGGQGVFVKEVQQAVLDQAADLAVHSAKDLPSEPVDGLVLGCVPERADPRDAIVGSRLEALAPGSTVATGSPRRRAQIAWLRPDLSFCELRGNIETRIERAVAAGAGILAMAALERLGLADRVAEVLDPGLMLPQVAQGALAVECRSGDDRMLDLLGEADDWMAHRAVDAERAWLAAIGGGCSLPVGAFAEISAEDGTISLEAMVASHDGRIVLRRSAVGSEPGEVGRVLAEDLLSEAGARAIEGWEPADGLL
jgi:hydroxymethylbilane synthase